MLEFPRYSEAGNIDPEAECLYLVHCNPTENIDFHSHEYYEIFITVSGTVTHLINGRKQNLPEGTLVFIRPDDVHSYVYETPERRDVTFVNLAFTRQTAESLFSYLSPDFPSTELLSREMPPSVLLSDVEKKNLLARVEELNLVRWQDKKALKVRMRTLLAEIFVRFFYSSPKEENPVVPVWLSSLLRDMESPEHFIIGMERMISLSGKSREHLARSMQKYYGKTCAEYINELRLNYASNLLLHTDTSVIDVCYDCGFQSVSYFYRVFKGKYGVSPKEFCRRYN